jgi:uncharacterized membrane protein
VEPLVDAEKKTERPDELVIDLASWSRGDEVKDSLHTLISHHPPSLFGHCVRLSFRGRSVYFCSRCTGIYGGLAIGVGVMALAGINLGTTWEETWLWFLIALALGFSTVTDWVSQRLTSRKTTNFVRISTGLLSGFGLAIVFILGDLLYMLVTLAVMMLSVGLVGIIETRMYRHESFDSDDE